MKNNAKITISVLITFIGICILSSTYYDTKKHEVFDDMNKLLYEQIVSIEDTLEIVEEKEIIEVKPNENIPNNINTTIKTTTTTKSVLDYSKYYIG